jgi:hypothetical protein
MQVISSGNGKDLARSINLVAIACSLLRRPRELSTLLRTVLDAQAARAALQQGRELLGPRLGLPEFRGR